MPKMVLISSRTWPLAVAVNAIIGMLASAYKHTHTYIYYFKTQGRFRVEFEVGGRTWVGLERGWRLLVVANTWVLSTLTLSYTSDFFIRRAEIVPPI